MDWKFGLVQSIAVILVIGFSVDYCVHVSNAYNSAPQTTPQQCTREARLKFALLTNGHAIMSSATVSILASIPILASEVKIYRQIAIITSLTITSSIFYTFGLFAVVMQLCAPQGTTGKLWRRNKTIQ